MNLEVDEDRNILAKKVYNPLVLQTDEGFEISICMRDWGYDIMIPKLNKHLHINDSGEIIDLRKGN